MAKGSVLLHHCHFVQYEFRAAICFSFNCVYIKSTNKYNKLFIVIPDKMLLKNTLVLVTIIFGNHFCLAASKTKVTYIFFCKVFFIDQSCKTSSGKYNIDGHLNSMYICYGNTRVDNALADAGLNMFFFI